VSGLDAILWLKSIGSNMGLVNSNGHGILHKSAQRGKDSVCRWIIENHDSSNNTKTHGTGKKRTQIDILSQIGPDEEGCCPSDLAGMEGFDSLANWLVNEEQKIGLEIYTKNSSNCPSWLKEGVHNSRHKTNMFGLDDVFEKGAGVKKVCAYIAHFIRSQYRSC
jgi:hypothetical protein